MAGEGQITSGVKTTVILSVFTSVVEVNVGELLPTLFPLSFHWYAGFAPPFVGAAVNVTEVPAHITFPGLALMITEETMAGLTVIVPVAFTLPQPPVRGME